MRYRFWPDTSIPISHASRSPRFDLAARPDGKPAPASWNAIRPLSTYRTQDGMGWAVFLSPRLGNALDLWLARGHGGQWAQFIFTGKRFPVTQMDYRGSSPPP